MRSLLKAASRRSVWIPAILLVYLAVMAYLGRGELLQGRYAYFFGIIGITLLCIYLLHRHLKTIEARRK